MFNLHNPEELRQAAIDAGFSESWADQMIEDQHRMRDMVLKRMCQNAEPDLIDEINKEIDEGLNDPEPFDFFDQVWPVEGNKDE